MRGFTLAETMVVVAVLGVMAALAIGGLQPTISRLRVAQSADQLQEALAYGRAIARGSGRCVHVDLAVAAPPADPATLPEVATGAQGTLVRVWRSHDITCPSPPAPANADLIESFPLPDGTGATFATGPEAIWLSSGRISGGLAARATVDTWLAATAGAFTVTAQPWGPVCGTLTSAAAACP